jgi:protein SCO1/2
VLNPATRNGLFHIGRRSLLTTRLLLNASDSKGLGDTTSEPKKPINRIKLGGKTINASRARQQRNGMLSWKAALVFLATGGAVSWFFQKEKKRIAKQREQASNKDIGKPQVGGSFNLVDHNGKQFTDQHILGNFSLIYFGFSMCPDICPEELEKMAEVLNVVNKDSKKVTPIFITCDPARDSPEVLKQYLGDFHPDIIGLTGPYEEIKKTCKEYRVYFSTPPDLKPGDEYLVDHSIFFYFMDPEGKFVDALGRECSSSEGIERIQKHINEWKPEAERDKQGFFSKLL